MQFLSASSIAIASALTIPPLIALYFLKLRRSVMPISSTLLWKKAIEDLHVNAPFQRLKSSWLLLLQLLVLVLAAIALGKPMITREKQHNDTLIVMIDQSASMSVMERNGHTRLDIAKREARKMIDAMDDRSRAMVIAFCDRATMVSSFDTDRDALDRRIDEIEQTQSTSSLAEAVSLAEAHSQNMIIGGPTAGSDIEVRSNEASASVVVFTDGRVADSEELSPQRLDLSGMEVVIIGERDDNVGILAMDAERNYERPEIVQVFATVRNFSSKPVSFDATLYINRDPVDVQSVELTAGVTADEPKTEDENGERVGEIGETDLPLPGSVASVAFDAIETEEEGVVEVRLSVDDALGADDRAWAILPPPRRVSVLLVTSGNFLLERLLANINVDLSIMGPEEYENAPVDRIADRGRSRFDVVIFDRHDSARLPVGNYMYWDAVPLVEGVEKLGTVDDEAIIDWDENHPILRHVAVGTLNIFEWKRLNLPDGAIRLIEGEGEDSTPLAYFTHNGSQHLICAFPFATDWVLRWDLVLFNVDAIGYLSSSVRTGGSAGLRPGQPNSISVPTDTEKIVVRRPDGQRDTVPTGGLPIATYARTRLVGTYEVVPANERERLFAVNLFDDTESRVRPKDEFRIGTNAIASSRGEILVNEALWPWFVVGLLIVSLLEWFLYNRRVAV